MALGGLRMGMDVCCEFEVGLRGGKLFGFDKVGWYCMISHRIRFGSVFYFVIGDGIGGTGFSSWRGNSNDDDV